MLHAQQKQKQRKLKQQQKRRKPEAGAGGSGEEDEGLARVQVLRSLTQLERAKYVSSKQVPCPC